MKTFCKLPWALTAVLFASCRGEPPEILSFVASPGHIQVGEASTLSWKTRGAETVTLKAGSVLLAEGLPPNGDLEVQPRETTTYSLTAKNRSNFSSEALTLGVGEMPEIVNFQVTPATVAIGQKATLSWSTRFAATISIHDGTADLAIDPSVTSGQIDVFPTHTTVYVLTAKGGAETVAQASVSLGVAPVPVIVAFSALPSQVNPGQPTQLSWEVQAANEVTITKASSGTTLPLGALAQNAKDGYATYPGRSETYRLTAKGPGGQASAETKVQVQPVISVFESTPPGVDPSETYSLSWTTHSAVHLRVLREGATVLLDTTDLTTADQGSILEPPPAGLTQVNYELEITSLEGVKVSRFLTVKVGPKPQILSYSMTPATLSAGDSFFLAWSLSGATSLVIKIDGATQTTLTSAARLANGTWTSPPQSAAGDHQVEFIARSAALSQEVRTSPFRVVELAAIVSFTATPSQLQAAGDTSTLAWEVTDGSRAELLVGERVIQAVSLPTGTAQVRVLTSGVYSLRAYNAAGDYTEESIALSVAGLPSALTGGPSPFVPGEELSVDWNVASWGATTARMAPAPFQTPADPFVDVSSSGSALAFPSADDSIVDFNFPSGFAVEVAPGTPPATSASISTNGFLLLASPGWTNPMPDSSAVGDPWALPLLVAPLWDDLVFVQPTPAQVRVQLTDPDTLVVQWTGAKFQPSASGSATFEVILHRDGRIDFRYQTLTSPGSEPDRAKGSLAIVGLTGPGAAWSSPFLAYEPRLTGVTSIRFLGGATSPSGSAKLRPDGSVEVGLVALDSLSRPLAASLRLSALPLDALLVNELLPVPATGTSPALGEWVELRNTLQAPLDLSGVVLTRGAESFALPAGVVVSPSGLTVLGSSSDPAQNGQVPVSVAWGSALSLPDTSGTLSLSLRGLPLASFTWGSGGFPTPAAGTSVRMDQVGSAPAGPNSSLYCLDPTPTPGTSNGGCYFDVVPSTNTISDLSATGRDLTQSGSSWRAVVDFTTLAAGQPPFLFSYFGTSFGKAEVSANGWLILFNGSSSGATSSMPTPLPLPTKSSPNAILAPFWDDLSTSKTQSASPTAKLYVQLQDPDNNPATANRVLWVQWLHFDVAATTKDADLTLEVRLHERGEIEFLWGNLSPGDAGDRALGSEASAGLEDPQGVFGISLPTPLTPNSAVRFVPP